MPEPGKNIPDDLVQRVRELLQREGRRPLPKIEDVTELLDQLRVYQTELQRQNLKLRQVQKELAQGLDFYTTLFDLTPVGLLLLNHRLCVQKANPTAVRILGPNFFPKNKPLSLSVDLAFLPILQRHYNQVAKNEMGLSCEVQFNTKHLGELIVRMRSVLLARDNGKPDFLTAFWSITSQRQGEKASCTHKEEIERHLELARLTADLAKERDKRLHAEELLKAQAIKLIESNTVLKVLLDHRQKEKEALQESMLASLQRLVVPLLGRLGESGLNQEQKVLLEVLETNLAQTTSGFAKKLGSIQFGLSPRELQVANFIMNGRTSDEIAEILFISCSSVLFHRNNIRKKLGLKGQRIRLATFLQRLT